MPVKWLHEIVSDHEASTRKRFLNSALRFPERKICPKFVPHRLTDKAQAVDTHII
jgi:hypothetical protein